MWRLIFQPWWRNCTDEWFPIYELERAYGLYLHNGFCLGGVYFNHNAKQYCVVVMNCNVGIWYDEYADLDQPLQYRIWERIKKCFQ
jgi:hypothetical protein